MSMDQPIRTLSIHWKEWRARRGLLIALAPAMLVLVALQALRIASPFKWLGIGQTYLEILTLMVLIGLLLGVTFLSSEEQDPARGFLYTLPISRRAILWAKLRALANQLALFAVATGLLMVLVFWPGAPSSHLKEEFRLYDQRSPFWPSVIALWITAVLLSSVAIVIGGVMLMHFRTVVTTLVLSGFWLLLCVFILGIDFMIQHAKDTDLKFTDFAMPTARLAVVLVALVGWLFYLFCRSPLRELSARARAGLALLFVVASLELFATVFYANPRDLVFILFGV